MTLGRSLMLAPLVFLIATAPGGAEVPPELRVPLSSQQAAALLPPFADDSGVRLFALKGSRLDSAATDAVHVATEPQEFGTLHQNYTTIVGASFQPADFRFHPTLRSNFGLGCHSDSTVNDALAQVDLLHGVRLEGLRLWAFDISADRPLSASMYEVCQTPGEPEVIDVTLLGGAATVGAGGPQTQSYLFPTPVTVDNTFCFYVIQVSFGNDGNCLNSIDLALNKVSVRWRRQVSPPPATATFDDVPASHLFFRQVEALAASGVTAGCDANSFCPNAPLTRGQMAAFLATALGLYWPPF